MVGVLFLVATVNAWFLVPAAIFMAIAYVTRFAYLRTARSLQRLDASSKYIFIYSRDTKSNNIKVCV